MAAGSHFARRRLFPPIADPRSASPFVRVPVQVHYWFAPSSGESHIPGCVAGVHIVVMRPGPPARRAVLVAAERRGEIRVRLRTRQVLVGLGGAAALAVLSVASTHLGYREPFSPWDPAIGAGAALILLGGGLMVLPVVAGQLAGAWLNGWLTPIGGGAAPVVVSVI